MQGSSHRLRAILDARFLIFLLLLALALGLRVTRLDQRPMHGDEAVNAVKLGELLERKGYRYDPNEHHGPTLYYASLPIVRLAGSTTFQSLTESRLRYITVLAGLGLIILLPLLTEGLGRTAVLWAAFFTALSPAMVFYSRYFIHEMLLVCLSFLTLAAGWRYWRSRKVGWILLAGAGLGLMQATKETFVISVGAATLALVLNQLWNRYLDASGVPLKAPPLNWAHAVAGVAIWIVVAVSLFSSFFTNAAGPLDSIRTYLPWLARAGGDSPHINPWNFYFKRLLYFHADKGPIWSEAFLLLLAIVGGGAAFVRKGCADANCSLVRFIAIYTLVLTAAYTLISYKTPWCLLNFWHGVILLAGVGATVICSTAKLQFARFAAGIVLLIGGSQLAAQAWMASQVHSADWRNPYVYSQTSPKVFELLEKVEALAQVDPSQHDMLIKIVANDGDFWPLPWYLRHFKQVGYWEKLPADPYAPVMIVSAGLNAALDEKKTHLMVGYFEFRPAVFFELYVELGLWRAYLEQHPPPP